MFRKKNPPCLAVGGEEVEQGLGVGLAVPGLHLLGHHLSITIIIIIILIITVTTFSSSTQSSHDTLRQL